MLKPWSILAAMLWCSAGYRHIVRCGGGIGDVLAARHLLPAPISVTAPIPLSFYARLAHRRALSRQQRRHLCAVVAHGSCVRSGLMITRKVG